jgi:amino-acid N-acetyltransferase
MTTVEVALAADRPRIEALLRGSGLPLDGLGLAISTAVVARADEVVVGCAAVEPYGSVGLLRSVCVAPDLRGAGIGHRLVEAAEKLAASHGISELWLLTETAESWFPRLGYLPATRGAIPQELGASPEVAGACPQGAAVLHKGL